MSDGCAIDAVVLTPLQVVGATGRKLALGLVVLGGIGLGLGFFGGRPATAWVGILVATILTVGLAAAGIVVSAIFEMTGAKWGRAYRRLAEGSVVLMPLGIVGIVVLVAGVGKYAPWIHAHHLTGGKAVWLTRGFWSLRVVGAFVVSCGVCVWYLYYSLRRDFCLGSVREQFRGRIAGWVASDLRDPESEARRCAAKLSTLAPVVAIVYALGFTLLGFDLVMALEPNFSSTLFGAWIFVGHLFCALALLAVVSLVVQSDPRLRTWLTQVRQSDLATLLFAFCLIHTDFLWSQYLTIWYGNLPEETGYVIARSADTGVPWRSLSWVAFVAIFFLPFVALLLRRIKQHRVLLGVVAGVVVVGVFLARFVEIAPPILGLHRGADLASLALPLAVAAMVAGGAIGAGWLLYGALFTEVPIIPVGDEVFRRLTQPGGKD